MYPNEANIQKYEIWKNIAHSSPWICVKKYPYSKLYMFKHLNFKNNDKYDLNPKLC